MPQVHLSEPQRRIFVDDHRFKVVVAGRRFGKTFLALIFLLAVALVKPKARCWYVAPTYKMAKRIAWLELLLLIPRNRVLDINKSDLQVTFWNGSTITLLGAEDPDSLRGPGIDALVLDEYAQQHKSVWALVLRAMLAMSQGPALFIGSPAGFNHFYDLFNKCLDPKLAERWQSFQFTTAEGGQIDPQEIEDARADMAEREFNQEFLAKFEALAGRIYYAFTRQNNMYDGLDFDARLDVEVGIDFNIAPGMHATVAQRRAGRVYFLDEVFIPRGNTDELSKELIRRYQVTRMPDGKHVTRKIKVYPDPTGKAGHTNAPAGQTDMTILADHGFEIYAPEAPYAQADKWNMVNAALHSSTGLTRAFVHPRCRRIIAGFEGLTYKGDTGQPDKSGGLDHITDAAAYMLCYLLPMSGNFLRQIEV